MSISTSMLRRLNETLGLTPSESWQTACARYLQQQDGIITEDAVFQQVLHSDLRDVIRPVASTTTSSSSPFLQLRRAMDASSPAPNTNSNSSSSSKQTLDASFRLLLQVEEIVDVSKTAEARLSLGGTSNSRNNHSSNSNRLLKLCCSDGYTDGRPILCMEQHVIPNFQTTTFAGCKLLVTGPIDLRWGMLQLNEGNCVVLGGQVPHLVQAQQQALAEAQQTAGVGVDATVRALIGTTNSGVDDDDHEEDDEGEAASGDVVAAPASTPTSFPTVTPTHQSMPPPQPPNSNHSSAVPTVSSISSSSSSSVNNVNHRNAGAFRNETHYASSSSRSITPPPPRSSLSSSSSHTNHNPYTSSTTTSSSTSSSRSSNPYAVQTSTTTTNNSPMTSASSSLNNPYASSGLSSSGTKRPATSSSAATSSTASSNPYASSTTRRTTTPPPPAAQHNPYASTTSTNHSINSNSFQTASSVLVGNHHPNNHSTSRSSSQNSHHQQPQPMTVDLLNDATDDAHSTTTTPMSSTTTRLPSPTMNATFTSMAQPLNDHPQQPFQILDFLSLKTILQQIANNQQLYESYVGTTFEVPMKQKEAADPQQRNPIYFNIIKNPKWNKKKTDGTEKYVFCMMATFGSDLEANVVVRCQIPHAYLEPYFPLSATDTRALSRTDHAQSQQMVSQGGQRVRAEYFGLLTWHATLLHTSWDEWVQACHGVPHWNHKDAAMLVLSPKIKAKH